MKSLKPLTPPDRRRCQAKESNGNSFMTFGGVPGLVRCKNKPVVIATERKPGDDGRIGSMSLCAECLGVFRKRMPADYATLKWIKRRRLTDAQRRILENVRAGRNAGQGFASGAYASQAAHQATCALIRRGLITMTNADEGPAFKLTTEGWDAIGGQQP